LPINLFCVRQVQVLYCEIYAQFFILDNNGVAPTADKAGRKDVVSVGPMDTVRFIAEFKDFSGTTP
jgi:hypothetical protein